jgi:hypothetical protein
VDKNQSSLSQSKEAWRLLLNWHVTCLVEYRQFNCSNFTSSPKSLHQGHVYNFFHLSFEAVPKHASMSGKCSRGD